MVFAILKYIFKFVTTTKSLFHYLRKRYSGDQVRDLNKLVRLRGKVRSVESRVSFLVGCLNAVVVPNDVATRVARSRARHSLYMERAFLIDDINKEKCKCDYLKSCLVRQMVVVKGFLSKYDYIRFCAYLGIFDSKNGLLNRQIKKRN